MAGGMGDADRIGIYGRSGSGKSTFAKALIRDRRRVIAFDPCDEYGDIPGFERFTNMGLLQARLARDPAAFRLAYIPPDGKEAERLNSLSSLVRVMQEPYRAGSSDWTLTFLVEELSMSFHVNGGDARAPGFGGLCARGRHYGVELVGVTQYAAEVGMKFRANAGQSVVFAQGAPRHQKAVLDLLGDGVTLDQVKALKPHEYLHRVEREGKTTPGRNTLSKPRKGGSMRNT